MSRRILDTPMILLIICLALFALVLLFCPGCNWSWWRPAPPPVPELCGPPAPRAAAPAADPLLPLLAWLSWISVAGMAASVAGAVFLSVFRSLAITAFCAFAAVLTFSRTLGHALPWLPWIGLAAAVLGIAYLLISRYRSLAIAAVDHGEMADDFITGLGRHVVDPDVLKKINEEWHDCKQVSGSTQGKLQGHIKALIKKVNS